MRESANIQARLRALRQALETPFMEVWSTALREMRYRFPLLVVDEAHHLKNAHTGVASLCNVLERFGG